MLFHEAQLDLGIKEFPIQDLKVQCYHIQKKYLQPQWQLVQQQSLHFQVSSKLQKQAVHQQDFPKIHSFAYYATIRFKTLVFSPATIPSVQLVSELELARKENLYVLYVGEFSCNVIILYVSIQSNILDWHTFLLNELAH